MQRFLAIQLILLGISLSAPAATGDAEQELKRWYTPYQVERGRPLYAKNCADCHGKRGESTPLWKELDKDGNFPPPPLNGTAHTWHHNLPLLRQIIREGGAKMGGKMPPFADKLSVAEIDAIIAWVQSLWPEKIYARWSSMQ